MRLLSKQTIQTEKVVERKREIDEGLKLAKKIDMLRETASKEEQNLAKFREANLSRLHKEIEPLAHKKQILLKEIEELQFERDRLKSIITSLKEI